MRRSDEFTSAEAEQCPARGGYSGVSPAVFIHLWTRTTPATGAWIKRVFITGVPLWGQPKGERAAC